MSSKLIVILSWGYACVAYVVYYSQVFALIVRMPVPSTLLRALFPANLITL
jgi:hypothetical protein